MDTRHEKLTVALNIRLSEPDRRKLEALCREKRLPISAGVRMLIAEAVDKSDARPDRRVEFSL